MARKDLLKSLLSDTGSQKNEQAPPLPPVQNALTRKSRGAIGAVSRSLSELKTNSIIEIEPQMISQDGLQDRIGTDLEDYKKLRESIREYGQQVPIMVRPNPNHDGTYLIVYGRRRLAALREIGISVKAIIRDLDDQNALLAQGQENTQRKNLSFIEKARFAHEMEGMGYKRKIICDALAIDKTEISRMLKITGELPLQWIEAIGPAPSIGRDRWARLGVLCLDLQAQDDILEFKDDALISDKRFKRILGSLEKQASSKVRLVKEKNPQIQVKSKDGSELASVTYVGKKTRIELYREGHSGFDDWLMKHLPEIYEKFKSGES